jgi:hypothetical protein
MESSEPFARQRAHAEAQAELNQAFGLEIA